MEREACLVRNSMGIDINIQIVSVGKKCQGISTILRPNPPCHNNGREFGMTWKASIIGIKTKFHGFFMGSRGKVEKKERWAFYFFRQQDNLYHQSGRPLFLICHEMAKQVVVSPVFFSTHPKYLKLPTTPWPEISPTSSPVSQASLSESVGVSSPYAAATRHWVPFL